MLALALFQVRGNVFISVYSTTLEATLRCSKPGYLPSFCPVKYFRFYTTLSVCVFFQDILSGCKDSLGLSPHSALILDRLNSSLTQKNHAQLSGSPSFSDEAAASVSSTESNAAVESKHSTPSVARPFTDNDEHTSAERLQGENLETEAMELSSPASPPAISLLSPKAMQVAGCIIRFQQQQHDKAKVKRKAVTQGAAVEALNLMSVCV